MKVIKLSFLAFLFCFSTTVSNAQVDVTVNPLGLLFENLAVGADFNLSENTSIEGLIGFGSSGNDDIFGYSSSRISLDAFYKYYFSPNRGCDKFYVGGFARFINRSYNFDDTITGTDYKVTRLGIGFGLGYKIVSEGGFVFDINIGFGRALLNNNNADDGTTVFDWSEFMSLGKFGFGYRF